MSMAEQTIIKADSYAHDRNQQLLEKEERELEALIKGEQVDEEAEDNQESDSQSAENTKVSDEGNTEQKETRSVEPKESEEVNTESDGLSAEEKSFKKRYGDIRKLLQTKEKDWDAKFEKLQGQLEKLLRMSGFFPSLRKRLKLGLLSILMSLVLWKPLQKIKLLKKLLP